MTHVTTHTGSFTGSFTHTHAKQLAAKIVADLYQCHRLYGRPVRAKLQPYEAELIELLAGGLVSSYEFGFKRNDARVVCWRYDVLADGSVDGGEGAGGIYARANIAEATYYNFMSYSAKWDALTPPERAQMKALLPIKRADASLPGDGNGTWVSDRAYVAGGCRVSRRSFRP